MNFPLAACFCSRRKCALICGSSREVTKIAPALRVRLDLSARPIVSQRRISPGLGCSADRIQPICLGSSAYRNEFIKTGREHQ